MGNCFSDVEGGKQAVGGTQQRPNSIAATNNNNGGHNDAVEFFFRSRGIQPLFTQIESDPMAVVYAKKRDGKLEELGRTEVVLNSLNPAWIEKVTVAFQFEIVQPLVFHVYDVDSKYHNVPMKIVTKQTRSLTLNLNNKNGHMSLRNLGTLTIHAEETISSRTCVEMIVTKQTRSLPLTLWLLLTLQAIMEIGEVIQFYDSDRRFPAWGFGGRTIDGTTSHCFNLNGSTCAFEVEGVEGIMAAYARALHNVALAGPTLFGPVINTAAQIAGQSISYNKNKYFVLLIITDGVITDLQETKDALVRASDLPLSILIVGVGGADFREMEVLDADIGRRLESSTGRVATRDIVQFVPMREALLEELPRQFLTYMQSRDIKPGPLHAASTSA
ncbi:protein bonzai 1 [Quercus suber]|uniref:Protein bonzai 1 n=1 Tax=Quercus suber TaxID=58331 RepID=A0AAW0LF32_QUESU